MKVRVHQDKRVGREVSLELDVVQSPTENPPALSLRGCPPCPWAESGI